MVQYKLYNTKDIDLLKEKLQYYEDTLKSQLDKTPLDFLEKNSELLINYKKQINYLERVIKNMLDEQKENTENIEKQIHFISDELKSLNNVINEVKVDINLIKNLISQIDQKVIEEFEKVVDRKLAQDNFQKSEHDHVIPNSHGNSNNIEQNQMNKIEHPKQKYSSPISNYSSLYRFISNSKSITPAPSKKKIM